MRWLFANQYELNTNSTRTVTMQWDTIRWNTVVIWYNREQCGGDGESIPLHYDVMRSNIGLPRSGKVREIPVFLRVREKSGNFVASQEILQFVTKVREKSGNFVYRCILFIVWWMIFELGQNLKSCPHSIIIRQKIFFLNLICFHVLHNIWHKTSKVSMRLKMFSCADLFSRPLMLKHLLMNNVISMWFWIYCKKLPRGMYRDNDWNLCWHSGKCKGKVRDFFFLPTPWQPCNRNSQELIWTIPNLWEPMHLKWHHHERDGVSNHRRLNCLLNHLGSRRLKKTSKLRVTGLCEGKPPVTGGFPSQRASNAEMFLFGDVIMRRSDRCASSCNTNATPQRIDRNVQR